MKLYHFTSVDAFCKIWVSKKMRFSNNYTTNDLFEKRKALPHFSQLFTSPKYKNRKMEAYKSFCKKYFEVLSLYQQISFTTDYITEDGIFVMAGWQSPMMWGQYAHNEHGVCIELDSELLETKDKWQYKVNYDDRVPCLHFDNDSIIDSKKSIEKFVNSNIKNLFFVKHRHWEYENEFRIIRRSKAEENLPINDAITAIYVFSADGSNTPFVDALICDEVPLYALFLKNDEERSVDRIEVSQYKEATEGRKPPKPSMDIKNTINFCNI